MQHESGADRRTPGTAWLERIFKVAPGELSVTLWSFAYFFFLMSGYFMLRPVRETMGIAGGVRQLPWLFTATFLTMLAAMPLYWALVVRFRRRTFIPVVYHFFALNLVLFFLVLHLWPEHTKTSGHVFFVWLSVFNLMAITVFWSFMADIFSNEQGRRLFGFIAGGGSLGALFGSLATSLLLDVIDFSTLLLLAAALLEAAVLCVHRIRARIAEKGDLDGYDRAPIGGGLLEGLRLALRSPYLLAICGYMFLATYTGTVLYFAQGIVVSDAVQDTAERIQLFSWINFAVQALTLLLQLFLSARVIRALGVGLTLTILPAVYLIGFTVVGAIPTLAVIVVFQVLRRGTSYGLAKPTKETLFTLVSDEEKYKSKGFIDTVVYRGGDAVAAWLFDRLAGLGLALGTIAYLTAPVGAVWIALGLFLGRKQEALRRIGQK